MSSISWQIPRNCLAWLLLAQLVLILPHVERLPWWVMVVFLACAGWRIMIYQGRWSMPPRWLKGLFAVLCFWGIYQAYGSLFGVEATVALLIAGFCLKLLEVQTKRDIYLLIFIAYFAAATVFLFSQDFLITLLVIAIVVIIATSQLALHQSDYNEFNITSLKRSLIIVMQAVPLMLVLFIIMPRFSPLWQVPLPSDKSRMGVSDTMSPGDISDLGTSTELAFRAQFNSSVPPKQKLYWRGLVLSEFDGRAWSQGVWKRDSISSASKLLSDGFDESDGNLLRYQITQEPSYQPWLFTLPVAYSDDSRIRSLPDNRLVRLGSINSRIQYSVVSDSNLSFGINISSLMFRLETQLPSWGNSQSRQYAQELFIEMDSEEAFINEILRRFNQQNFIYTLKPPKLNENTIDEFLFTTRRGFCEHYASSFVFLMRAAGIPARVVTGYQGGEINPITGTVLVHQFDAHAWAEVWLKEKGWVRYDPTAAVAPERIEFGLEQALAEEGSFLEGSVLSPLRYRNVLWINTLRLQMDAFNYYWASNVLQYRDAKQWAVLKRLLGDVTPVRMALMITVFLLISMLLVGFYVLSGRSGPKQLEAVRLYLSICKRLELLGYKRLSNEGAIDFARRVASTKVTNKKWLPQFQSVTRLFVALMYEEDNKEKKNRLEKQLKREITKLNYQLTMKG